MFLTLKQYLHKTELFYIEKCFHILRCKKKKKKKKKKYLRLTELVELELFEWLICHKNQPTITLSAGAVECVDCTSAEGVNPPPNEGGG